MNPDSHTNEVMVDRGFWAINIGHVATMVVFVFSLGCAWQGMSSQFALQTQKQEQIEREISAHDQQLRAISEEQSTERQEIATDHQDNLDLHKTIESDLERRMARRWQAANPRHCPSCRGEQS